MELVNEFINNQFALYIPVALVLVGAILVFAFGFKSAEQPPFDKLSSISNEERKSLGKKRKLKEKKSTANGNVVNVNESKTDKSPSKEAKRKEQSENIKKTDNTIKSTADKKKNDSVKPKVNEERNKKASKRVDEKPLDFDDGNWETVPAKGEKKKKQDSPIKKEKKSKKSDKSLEIDKLVKDTVNKELQEKEKTKEPAPTSINEEESESIEVAEIKIEQVELKKEKKTEKKVKKNDIEQSANIPIEIVEDTVTSPAKLEQTSTKTPSGTVAFDELGDIWTEAKQPKKSKKKSRRDN